MSIFVRISKNHASLTKSEIVRYLSDMIVVHDGFIEVKPPTPYHEVWGGTNQTDSKGSMVFDGDRLKEKKNKDCPNPRSFTVVKQIVAGGFMLKSEDGEYRPISECKSKLKER